MCFEFQKRAHQDEGAAGATEDVGPGALEKGLEALVAVDLAPRIHGAIIHAVAARAGLRVMAALRLKITTQRWPVTCSQQPANDSTYADSRTAATYH